MKASALLLVGTIIPFLLFGGCLKSDNNTNDTSLVAAPGEAWTETDTILDLCIYQIDTLNPLKTSVKHNAEVLSVLYDSLFSATTNFTAEKQLAEQYEIAPHGKEITIKIRKDVYFSNNHPLTAKDVAASFNTIAASNGYYRKQLPNLIGAKATNAHVTIFFSMPITFPEILLDVPILPNGGVTKKETDSPYADDISPGSGRYTLTEYRLNQEIHLQANQHHFSGTIPKIEQIVIHIVKDKKYALSMLENSQIDILTGDVADMYVYTPQKELQALSYPSCDFYFMGIKQTPSIKNTPFIQNVISEGINRNALLNKTHINGTIAYSARHPNMVQSKEERPLQYKSKDLLAANGWLDENHDGILEKKVGKKTHTLSFELLVHKENTTHVLLAEALQKQLAEIGVDLKIQLCTFRDYQSKIKKNDYDFFLGEAKLLPNFDPQDMEKMTGMQSLIGICFENELLLCDRMLQTPQIQTINPYKSIGNWFFSK